MTPLVRGRFQGIGFSRRPAARLRRARVRGWALFEAFGLGKSVQQLEWCRVLTEKDLDVRERNTIDFGEGKYRLLATKKELSGSGCNFQRYCHREIFVGIDYEFNDFIQAIHRCYRFLQKEPVIIDIIFMETEQEVLETLKEKWRRYDDMTAKMEAIIKKYGLAQADAVAEMKRAIGVKIEKN